MVNCKSKGRAACGMAQRFPYLPFDLVERKWWGAEAAAEGMLELDNPVPIVLHTYTDTEPCFQKGQCIKRMKAIQARDLADGLPDIRYNFVIGGEGTVFVGRGWDALPDVHEDFPELYERSIEIAHIGFPGEPTDEVKHVVKLFLRFGVATKHLRSDYKYVKHFKEILKDEEHYQLSADGDPELISYKRFGEETERDEADEYKVLSDVWLGHGDLYMKREDDDVNDCPDLGGAREQVEVMDGVKIDTSLLDPDDFGSLGRPKPTPLQNQKRTPLYE